MFLSAGTMTGDAIVNANGDDLGTLEEIMIDVESGEVAYAVLSYGGLMGMGNKLFAIPWEMLEIQPAEKRFQLDVPEERLKEAPGFDKSDWPDTSDEVWAEGIDRFWYGDEGRARIPRATSVAPSNMPSRGTTGSSGATTEARRTA